MVLFLVGYAGLQAQEKLQLTKEQAENIFLQNNLLLISENLNIEKQKAEVIQARLWPNPEFEISEVNLWRTTGVESSPPFFGNFGRDQQISFELNQLIETAGKRKKLVALEKMDVEKSEQYFEDLLRNLKHELRTQLSELHFVQNNIKIHENLVENLDVLLNAHHNQLEHGNISRAQYLRLKAQKLEIAKKILGLEQSAIEIQKSLKNLLRLNPDINIEIIDDFNDNNIQKWKDLLFEQLLEIALENRPDYQLSLKNQEYANKLWDYEKSLRVPDLTFGVSYDRNGSTMLDFVGFGVALNLPIFDRNQGNILKAELNIEKAEIEKQEKQLTLENEIFLSYQSLLQTIDFYENIDSDFENELDMLLENYTRNFRQRNLSMLEYLDYLDTYLENKNILLKTKKDIQLKIEELNYQLGVDI